MQTQLVPAFSNTREGEVAEAILRKCVHCGFCTATCPTYQLMGDELDSPRGRIYLMKQVLEGQEVTRKTQQHLDRCLTCRNCESTCQFSGGMRQRVVIALALAAEPKLIVADEPTTALDVSIQAQIIALLKKVCRERGAAVLLVTHDMGVIAETCDRVAVMYAGRIAEIGPVHHVINQPAHPYSTGLMASIPDMEQDREQLNQIDGAMPRLNAIPRGCAFNPRCAQAFERCRVERPDLMSAGATRAACWLHADGGTVRGAAMAAAERPIL